MAMFPSACGDKQSYELANLLKRLSPDIFIVRHTGMSVWELSWESPRSSWETNSSGLGTRASSTTAVCAPLQ